MNTNINNKTSYSNGTARPNQNVRKESRDALLEHIQSGDYKTEYELVRAVFIAIEPTTRRELSASSGLPINHITRIAKSLLQNNIAIEMEDSKKCRISNRKVNWLRLKTDEDIIRENEANEFTETTKHALDTKTAKVAIMGNGYQAELFDQSGIIL